MPRTKLAREAHVIEHIQAWKKTDVLKRPGNSRRCDFVRFHSDQIICVDRHPPVHCLIHTREQIENSGLACPIRSDQAVKRTSRNTNRKMLYRLETAEGNADVVDFEQKVFQNGSGVSHVIRPRLPRRSLLPAPCSIAARNPKSHESQTVPAVAPASSRLTRARKQLIDIDRSPATIPATP